MKIHIIPVSCVRTFLCQSGYYCIHPDVLSGMPLSDTFGRRL